MSKIIEPTELEYFLKCKIQKFIKHVKDNDKTYTRELVILVPEHNDAASSFFRAWLPDTREEYFELVAQMPYPIDSIARLSIHRGPNEKCEKHHLFVMSKGVEELILQNNLIDKTIHVKILPESQDEQHDQVRDSSGDFDLVHGQDSF